MSTATIPAPIVTFAPTRPLDIQQISHGHVTICSIYPQALHKRIGHNGMTDYRIAAAPRGSYSLLRVFDTQQRIKRVSETNNKEEYQAMPIPARIVAENLVHDWADDTLGARSGYRPGIAIIAGDEPTEGELSSMRSTQSALFNWYINDAQGKHVKGQTNEITDIHRLAAREMLDKGADRLPWIAPVDFEAVKSCMACTKQIPSGARVCPECKENLVDWYLKYNLPLDEDPAVKEFVEKHNLRKVAAAPVAPPVKSVSGATVVPVPR